MSGLLVIPTNFTPAAPPPGGTPWPSAISEVGTRGTLGSAPSSGTGWSRSGSVISTTANNAVIQGYNNVTTVILKHPGYRVSDMLIDAGGPGVNDACVQIWSAATDGLIEYSELRNSFTAISPERTFSHGWTADRTTADHVLIQTGHENAINPGSDFVLSNSVIRRFHRNDNDPDQSHYDGVELFGGEDGVTVYNTVIFLTSDGLDDFSLDSWLPDTGAINLFGNIDDFCMYDSIVGGGSSCFNFDDAGLSPGNTNVRIGKNRAGASHPVYYVRDTAGQIFRDDTNLTIAGWEVYFAEDDGTNSSTFDNTLTASAIGSP